MPDRLTVCGKAPSSMVTLLSVFRVGVWFTELTFTVTVNSVNQAPTLNTLNNVTMLEGALPQTVNLSGITSGATNENQTLTVTASSSNPALIPNPTVTYTSPNTTGSILFAPLGLGNGSATITVTVNDG